MVMTTLISILHKYDYYPHTGNPSPPLKKFQFYISTIITVTALRTYSKPDKISILHKYDYYFERQRIESITTFISILHKYDYYQVLVIIQRVVFWFQFYISTIITILSRIYYYLMMTFQFYISTIITEVQDETELYGYNFNST